MSGVRTFVDTNVLVYAFTKDEPEKKDRALSVLDNCLPVISSQVLKEFANVLLKKKSIDIQVILDTLHEITSVAEIVEEKAGLVFSALRTSEKYGYSFFDSLIIEAALTADCAMLLSEDMQDGQIIGNKLRILNPFKVEVRKNGEAI